jgi:hypothetical protein
VLGQKRQATVVSKRRLQRDLTGLRRAVLGIDALFYFATTSLDISLQNSQHEPGRCRSASLGWAGLGWAGLGWAGLGWAGLAGLKYPSFGRSSPFFIGAAVNLARPRPA